MHGGPVRRTDLWLMIGRDASMITGRETMEQRRRTSSRGSRANRGLAASSAVVDEGDALPSSRIDHILLHRGASLVALETRLVFDTPATAVSDHPGILIRLAPTTRSALSWTRITAHVDPGAGHFLALRGDTLPLDWARGWPMFRMDASTWVFMAAEVTGGFEYKVLVDDTTWMTGANASGVGGVDQDLTPTF